MGILSSLPYDFLTQFTVSDTVDGYLIEHVKDDGSKCLLTPRSDYFVRGNELVALMLEHFILCEVRK